MEPVGSEIDMEIDESDSLQVCEFVFYMLLCMRFFFVCVFPCCFIFDELQYNVKVAQLLWLIHVPFSCSSALPAL